MFVTISQKQKVQRDRKISREEKKKVRIPCRPQRNKCKIE